MARRISALAALSLLILIQAACARSDVSAPLVGADARSTPAATDGEVAGQVSLLRAAPAPRFSIEGITESSVMIGAPYVGFNVFPFGGRFDVFAGTRYQQAYAASNFGMQTPMFITRISFVDGAGVIAPSLYHFRLSTIAAHIDALSAIDFDGNRGGNDVSFANVALGGAAPQTLAIDGDMPFVYDPSSGNLLLDIVVTPGGVIQQNAASYASRNNALGVFSRYQDFGNGSAGFGLVTQFDFALPTPDNVMAIAAAAAGNGTLQGEGGKKSGVPKLVNWLARLAAAQKSATHGNVKSACAHLESARKFSDGDHSPPDQVSGPAAAVMAQMIAATQQHLGCR